MGFRNLQEKLENKFDFFFVLSSLCKRLRHEEISDRFLSVSPLLHYRGKTIESHCLDDDSALKKRNLFSRSIHSKDHTIVELLAAQADHQTQAQLWLF